LGARTWELLNQFRGERQTGRSTRVLCGVLDNGWLKSFDPEFLQGNFYGWSSGKFSYSYRADGTRQIASA
jgi:hypothetical protein